MATKIMVIRHAEKPEPPTVTGVDDNGQPNPKSLTPRGWQRAGALVQFFAPGLSGEPRPPLSRPQHLFAAYADPTKNDESRRPQQTLLPLAEHLGVGITFDCSIRKDDINELLMKSIAADGAVLISWEHKRIAPMARMLVAHEDSVPDWPDNRFDMVWILDWISPAWSLTQMPQLLLAGDRFTIFS